MPDLRVNIGILGLPGAKTDYVAGAHGKGRSPGMGNHLDRLLILLAPGGGSDCRIALILNKLVKILDAQSYQNARNSVFGYVIGTRDLLHLRDHASTQSASWK